jgi:phage gp36-like protein
VAAYASISDLITRRDKRLIGELMGDMNDTPTDAELLASDVLSELLVDASGQVESAMLSGKRYLPADLESLTGNSLGFLKKIVCTIAMADLYERRPGYHMEQAKAYTELAQAYLKALRNGENLFNLDDHINAANPDTTAPTVVDYTNLNFYPEQMGRHLVPRWNRLPAGR